MSWRAASIVLVLMTVSSVAAAAPMRVGSKRFTESYVLAEIVADLARAAGAAVKHEQGLGATAVTFRAIEDGAIDVYPEYTGTLVEITKSDEASLRATLAARGLAMSEPIGFTNTYALATKGRSLTRMSELAGTPLRYGLSHEFVGRSDGWPGLATRYGLGATPRAMDHALSYEAIAKGEVDVIDVYTTDAKIPREGLTVLDDDRRFFPRYDAVLLYRSDLPARVPAFEKVLARMKGAIDAKTMQHLNGRAELDGIAFADVAHEWTRGATGARRLSFGEGLWLAIVNHGPTHVALVLAALVLSTFIGIPLGVLAHLRPRAGSVVLGVTGVVQTIPSLALFCFFIPLLGIGIAPAVAALLLYGLLPIVRNTHAGLVSVPPEIREAAVAIGLSPWQRLRHVELPLASRTIVAGVKTSGVVAVGAATIAAFIGAGGFGEPISTGLSLNDVPMLLHGAIPAAGLALIVQGLFSLLERAVVPRPLR